MIGNSLKYRLLNVIRIDWLNLDLPLAANKLPRDLNCFHIVVRRRIYCRTYAIFIVDFLDANLSNDPFSNFFKRPFLKR